MTRERLDTMAYSLIFFSLYLICIRISALITPIRTFITLVTVEVVRMYDEHIVFWIRCRVCVQCMQYNGIDVDRGD